MNGTWHRVQSDWSRYNDMFQLWLAGQSAAVRSVARLYNADPSNKYLLRATKEPVTILGYWENPGEVTLRVQVWDRGGREVRVMDDVHPDDVSICEVMTVGKVPRKKTGAAR